MGVETFQSDALKAVKRAKANERLINKIGISVNIDLMVGMPKQSLEGCFNDMEAIASIGPGPGDYLYDSAKDELISDILPRASGFQQ